MPRIAGTSIMPACLASPASFGRPSLFFLASFFLSRYLQQMGIPKGMTRSLVVFSLALAVSYGVAALIDWAFA